jgi:capsid protein
MQKTGVIEFGEGKSEIVDARHVIHDFRRDRIQMGRGIPDLISSLAPARDLYEITTSKTKQVKDASRIIGWLTSGHGPDSLEKLGYDEAPDLPADATGTAPDTDRSERPADEIKQIQLKDGTFPQLDPEEKLEFLEQKYDAKDYKELIYIMLHAVAAPVGLPVELWFSGLGEINYSGFKGLGTQWHRRRRELIEDCEERLLDPLRQWRMDKAFEEGEIELPDDVSTAELQPHAHRWAWQRTAVLDEERDAKTNETKLRTGEVSLTDVWEQNGLDPDEEFTKRRQQYVKMRIAAGDLEPGTDPATVKVPYEYLLTGELPEFRRQQAAERIIQNPEDA